MRVNILYEFKNEPWGGGNQFLKALEKEFVRKGFYIEDPAKADVILFNSHHNFNNIFKIKRKFRDKIFIHRIAGPICLTRGAGKDLDRIIFGFNKLVADGIIFQSEWSRKENKKIFRIISRYETVIHNAPDKEVFNSIGKEAINPKEKIKLISTSWSLGRNKGTEIFKFLDKNLDFSKYQMTFVGNPPVELQNIKVIKPVSSKVLAEIIKKNQIYIFASRVESCSNALIEALSCKLPAVAALGSSNPEVIQGGGELFANADDIIEKIEKVAKSYTTYQNRIPDFSIEKVAEEYRDFFQTIYEDFKNKKYKPKQVNLLGTANFIWLKLAVGKMRVVGKFKNTKEKVWEKLFLG